MLAASLFGKFLPRSSIGCCEVSSRVRELHMTFPGHDNKKNFKNVKEDELASKLGLPPAPVHPLRPWFQHYWNRKDQVPHIDLNKRLAFLLKEYSSAPEEERKQLWAKYKMDLQDYKQKFEEYKKTLTEDEQKLLETALESFDKGRLTKKLSEKQQRLKMMQNLGQPKRLKNPFLQFLSDRKLSGMKLMGKAGLEWKALPNAERERYEADYQKRLKEYLKKKEEFIARYEQNQIDYPEGDDAKLQEWRKLLVKPSAPLKIFQQFYKEEKLAGGEVALKKVVKKYRELSSTEKARYETEYLKKSEEYKEQMTEYHEMGKDFKKTLTKEDKKLFQTHFLTSTRKNGEKQKEAALGKRPLSGYNQFCVEYKEQAGSGFEWMKRAALEWSKLSETEKARYNDMQRKQCDEYRKKVQEFDKKKQ